MTDDLDTAEARRRRLEPDIAFGHLHLWIGRSRGRTWLDVALRVGDQYGTVTEYQGALLQRRDLKLFPHWLADFEAVESGELLLMSEGGSLGITLKRYAHPEANYCNVRLRRLYFDQTISFPIRRGEIDAARAGICGVVERLDEEEEGRWRPSPERAGVEAATGAMTAAAVTSPPPPPPPPPFEGWDSGLGEGEPVQFDYVVDGVGWYHVNVRAGSHEGAIGGGDVTDALGDLVRAALALLAGAWRAEVVCNAEPSLTRIEFERVRLRQLPRPDGGIDEILGCRIRIQEVDFRDGEPGEVELDVLCRSPREVAEAIYLMAVPHYDDHARGDYLTLAALEGALAAVREAERHGR